VLALVDTLLRHLPERVRIVIASRTVPPRPRSLCRRPTRSVGPAAQIARVP